MPSATARLLISRVLPGRGWPLFSRPCVLLSPMLAASSSLRLPSTSIRVSPFTKRHASSFPSSRSVSAVAAMKPGDTLPDVVLSEGQVDMVRRGRRSERKRGCGAGV